MSDPAESFLASICQSYQAYNDHGSRSPEKIKPPHQWLADFFKERLGDEYSVHSLRKDNKGAREISAPGCYYNKMIDIGIRFKGNIISCVGFKFITSNYKQNSNNFFENMLGETANLQRGNIDYGSLTVLPPVLRYLRNDGSHKRDECVTTKNLEKYLQLYRDDDFPHKPKALGLVMVDINYENKVVSGYTNIDETGFPPKIKEFLKSEVDLMKFLNSFVCITKRRAEKV